MAGAFGVPTGLQAEVETQDDQFGDVSGGFIVGVSCCGHDRLDDAQGGGFFLFNREVFDPICF